MAYLTPGVYVEEKSSGEKPIAGVGTGTGGFVGLAEKGPIGKAVLVTNYTQYKEVFGGYLTDWYMPYAVEQFFKEGGSKCFVVRTAPYGTAGNRDTNTTPGDSPASAILDDAATAPCLTLTAVSPGEWGNAYSVTITDGGDAATQFRITVIKDGKTVETHDVDISDLGNIPVSSQVRSGIIEVTSHANTNRPANIANKPLAGGTIGLTGISIADFQGSAASTAMNGLYAFDPVDEVNMIAMPDIHFIGTENDILDGITAGLTYCENRKDCFFVGDIPDGNDPTAAETFKTVTGGFSSSYGAIYYPWIKSGLGGSDIWMPPSGAVMGVISRTDASRGVFKAPAGIIDGKMRTAKELRYNVSHGKQEGLNDNGVNVIRQFAGPGNVIWGARTCSSKVDPEWRYINVRRYFMYVEETLDEATQWVVFEPNTPALWGNVKRNITAFLTNEWRAGALFGNSADEAFFVKVDEQNNPPSVRNLGQLIIEIGIAPVKPAEFVIIRISQKTLES